ncbi:MAG: hypothetical protein WD489_07900 [Rhodovibrionaceae bacterium]
MASTILLAAAPAVAGIQDFFIHNDGKFAIYYIYISPDYSTEWEEDVLDSDVLMPGDSLEIEMIDYGNHCYFDILIEDSQGNSREYRDVDLCDVVDVHFP